MVLFESRRRNRLFCLASATFSALEQMGIVAGVVVAGFAARRVSAIDGEQRLWDRLNFIRTLHPGS